MKKYDIVIIGGGAGGLTVAVGAASMGAKVALVENHHSHGIRTVYSAHRWVAGY